MKVLRNIWKRKVMLNMSERYQQTNGKWQDYTWHLLLKKQNHHVRVDLKNVKIENVVVTKATKVEVGKAAEAVDIVTAVADRSHPPEVKGQRKVMFVSIFDQVREETNLRRRTSSRSWIGQWSQTVTLIESWAVIGRVCVCVRVCMCICGEGVILLQFQTDLTHYQRVNEKYPRNDSWLSIRQSIMTFFIVYTMFFSDSQKQGFCPLLVPFKPCYIHLK